MSGYHDLDDPRNSREVFHNRERRRSRSPIRDRDFRRDRDMRESNRDYDFGRRDNVHGGREREYRDRDEWDYRERERERDNERERDRASNRDRDTLAGRRVNRGREREKNTDSRGGRSVNGRVTDSRSRSPKRESKDYRISRSSDIGSEDGQTAEVDETHELTEEEKMQQLLGFGGFTTTKGKKVTGTDVSAVNVEKKRTYRQYMNRRGGFNRNLSPTR